jgi:hypothetical protein
VVGATLREGTALTTDIAPRAEGENGRHD